MTAVNAAGSGKPSDPSSMFAARPMKEKPRLWLDDLMGRKIKVRAGEPINVTIPLSGAPAPEVEWTKGTVRLPPSARVSTDMSDEKTILRIEDSNRGDAGIYTITATNEFGKDSAEIEVIVVDKPGVPEGPLAYTDTSAETITLEWSPPKDNGGGDINGYIVEISDAGADSWRQVPGYCPKTAFTVKGLTEGKQYVFRVRAENIYGVSDPLEGKPVTAKSPFDPPDAPHTPVIKAYSPNSCTLEWRAPDHCGGRPITGYIIEKRERGGEWVKANNYPTPNLSYTVQDLREGGRYEFRVMAVNEAGPGKPSKATEPITAQVQCSRPDAPDAPHPDRINKNSVTLSWSPPKRDGGTRIKGYILQKRCTVVKSAGWSDVNESLIHNTVHTVPHLQEGEEYHFRVIAVNDVGKSDPSKPSPAVVVNEQPNKPKMDLGGVRDIIVRAGEDFSIHVPYVGFPKPTATWHANDGTLTDSDSRVHQQLADDYASLVVTNSKRTDAGQYRLQLKNPSGFDTATVNVRVLDRPGKPDNLRADEFAGDSLTLFWYPPKDDGGSPVTNYVIEKREARTLTWSKVSSYCTVPFVRVRNLSIGREYEFRVFAENQFGQSEPAMTEHPIRARHPFDVPGAPGAPKDVDTTGESISICWTKPRHDGGAPISGYVVEKRLISEDKWTKATFNNVPDLHCKVVGLIENHEYEFRVAAVNAAGQGPWSPSSDTIACRAPRTPPKITSDLSIRDMTVIAGHEFHISVPFIGNPKPKVGWSINGVEVLTDERIKFETDSTETRFVNKSAKRNETGVYTIQLTNSEGGDSASCRVLVVDRPSPPQGPLDVTDVTPDTCTLSYKTPLDDGGSPITNYVVEKMDANGLWARVSSFVRGTHYEVMGLEPNRSFFFRVRAENQYGVSEPLTRDDPVLATYPFTVPDAPGTPKVIDWDSSNVKLIWDRPRSDGGSRIQGYQLEYREVSDPGWTAHNILIKDNQYQLYNLESGREYEFRVRARNTAGFSKPSHSSHKFKIKEKFSVPTPPQAPAVVKVGKNYVDLKWQRPVSDGGSRITGYVIERRDVGGAIWVKCNDYNVLDLEYTVMHLIEGADYEFRISAVNAAGRSDPSSCTTPVKVCEVVGGSKPEWIRTLQNAVVPHGKHVTLECSATGKPMPTARWLRNGREISLMQTPGARVTAESENGVFRLQLIDAKHSDEGDYTCEAINSLGFVHTTAHLKVGTPPRIDRMPSELKLAESDNSKIKVYYSGDQPIEFTLKRNGIEVTDTGRTRWNILDDYIAIAIKDVCSVDAGEYEVGLHNDSGSAIGNFNVKITGLPGPPVGPLGISHITKHTCTLSWKPPTYDGGLKVTHYVVERRDMSHAHWITVNSSCKDVTCTIQGLAENQDYSFRVSAVNDNGKGPALTGANPIRAKAPFDVPSPPGVPQITEVGDDFAHLEWEKPESDGGARVQGYWIDKREKGCEAWQRVNVAICQATQINCANLIEGLYCFAYVILLSKIS